MRTAYRVDRGFAACGMGVAAFALVDRKAMPVRWEWLVPAPSWTAAMRGLVGAATGVVLCVGPAGTGTC